MAQALPRGRPQAAYYALSPSASNPSSSRPAPTQSRLLVIAQSQQNNSGGGLGALLKRIQGALPIVGLVSRLTSVSGGVGTDELQYTEYSRAVFEAAPEPFQIAVADLQQRHGQGAQRRYILLALWMARQGVGLLPAKAIVDSARRLRVSQDLEIEMDRFSIAFEEAVGKYSYLERPRGAPQERADVAVDALARLCLGLKDGEALAAEDAALVEDAVCGGFWDAGEGFREAVRRSIAGREQRAAAYV